MKTKFREDRPNQVSKRQQNPEVAHFKAKKAEAIAQADQPISYKAVKENDGTYSIRYSKNGGNWEVIKLGVRGCNINRTLAGFGWSRSHAVRYQERETIQDGPYKGFVVVVISRGWYTVYHPSNGNDATTKIRWAWGY